MSTHSRKKLNQLLSSTPRGIVLLSSWLKTNGYSSALIKRYRNSSWLESIGTGANICSGDNINYLGALYALQTQSRLNIHIGARTAFSLLGKSHYLELAPKNIILFTPNKKNRLPAWFQNFDWQVQIKLNSTDFLPPDIGLTKIIVGDFSIMISNEIRALFECLHITPNKQELIECYEFMEGMNNVHPKKVQELLEHCNSIKVKRLFLYLADKAQHEWFNYLDLSKICLGAGKRLIIKGGVLDETYNITIPKDWKK